MQKVDPYFHDWRKAFDPRPDDSFLNRSLADTVEYVCVLNATTRSLKLHLKNIEPEYEDSEDTTRYIQYVLVLDEKLAILRKHVLQLRAAERRAAVHASREDERFGPISKTGPRNQ